MSRVRADKLVDRAGTGAVELTQGATLPSGKTISGSGTIAVNSSGTAAGLSGSPDITAFPSDGYDGIVFEGGIPLTSMCSHHHQTIMGRVHVAYIPGKDSKVIGLSKLNRLVEHFGRRGAIQEQLTVAIHNAIDTIINDNKGVAVMIDATHNCVSCRGVKHGGASMKTSKLTGAFKDDPATRNEYYEFVRGYGNCNT